MRSTHSVASLSRCAGPPGRDAARSARLPVVDRDALRGRVWPAEAKWYLACGFAHACPAGDVLVVTKLDHLARSLRDATDIADELTNKGVALNLGGARYDPTDPVGRLLFDVLGMVAEFEADLIRARTREGLAIAKAAGKLRADSDLAADSRA